MVEKILKVFLLCVFICNSIFTQDIAQALAPELGMNTIETRRDMLSTAFALSRVVYADSEEDMNYLKNNHADALLLSSGKYLFDAKYREDHTGFIRKFIHEDIEILMQTLYNKPGRAKYSAIREYIVNQSIVLSYYEDLIRWRYAKEGIDAASMPLPDFRETLVINDMIASAFELIYIVDNHIVSADDLSMEEYLFYFVMKEVIDANRYNYFTDVFWDAASREKIIRIALANGENFYQTASTKDADSGQANIPERSLTEKIREKLDAGPDEKSVYSAAVKVLRENISTNKGLNNLRGWDNKKFMQVIPDELLFKFIVAKKIDAHILQQIFTENIGVDLPRDVRRLIFPAIVIETRKVQKAAQEVLLSFYHADDVRMIGEENIDGAAKTVDKRIIAGEGDAPVEFNKKDYSLEVKRRMLFLSGVPNKKVIVLNEEDVDAIFGIALSDRSNNDKAREINGIINIGENYSRSVAVKLPKIISYGIAISRRQADIYFSGSYVIPEKLREVIERNITINFRDLIKGYDYDYTEGRNVYIDVERVLGEPLDLNGKKIRMIKIKGVCFNADEQLLPFEGLFPLVTTFGKNGEVISEIRPDKKPTGAMELETSITEYELTDIASRSGADVAVALGRIEFQGVQYQGKRLGGAILGIEGKEEHDFRAALTSIIGFGRGNVGKDTFEVYVDPEKARKNMDRANAFIRSVGAAYRKLHDIGVIQHMAHLGNVVATPDGKIRIEDFEYGERVKDFTVQQEMAYRVNDIRGFFLNYIAHLNPRLIEDLKNVFEIDIYREFLKGYLGEFANDHNLVFASFGALQNALQEVTRAPGITDTHPLLFSVKQVVEKSRNNENNATENLLSSDDTPNPHAAGHVATFFDLLYKEENRGKPRSLMYLRKQVPSKMTGGDIAKLTAMQDLSKLKLAGLVRKKGEKSDSIYWSIIEDEKAINALYVRLSRLLASASTKDVQNAVREVIESLGGSIELIPGRKGNADEFVIHLPAKDGEGDEHDGYAFDERELDTINEKIVRWFYTGEGLEDGDYLITTLNVAGRKDIEVDKKMASFYVVPWNQVEKKDRSQVVFRAEDDINYGLVLNCYFLEDFERGKTDQPVVTYRYNPAAGKAVKVDLAAMEITDYYYGYRKVYSADRVYREVARKAGKSIYVRVGIPMGTKRTGDKEKSFMLPLPGDESLVGRTIIVTLEDDINQGQVINAYLGNESGEKREKLLITYKMKNVLEVGEDGKKEKRKAEEISLGGRDIVDIYEGRERELKICGRPFFANIQRLENGGGQVSVPLHWRGEKARYIRLYIDKKYLDESSFGKPVVSMVEDDPNHGQVINTYFVNEHGQKTGWPISTYKYDPDEIRILKYPAVKGDGHLVEKEKHGVSLQVDLGILDINRYISDKTDRNIAFIDRRPIEIAVYECDDHRGGVIYKAVHNRIDLEFQLENNAGDFFKGSGKPWKAICSLKFDEDYGLYIEISKDENILGRYYYLERLGRCTPVDFSKMALIDYVNGNKNIKGMDTEPRRYDHTAKVLNKGHVDIRARGQGLDFCRLTQLVGKYPIFIPERNGDDWEIKVYDREKYTESGQNEPAIVMVRNKFFKTLIPKNKREYFEAKEYYEQGFYGMAKRMLKDIQDRGEGDREITRLANEIDEVIVRLNEWLDMGIPFGDAETWEYYLKALVNALFCKDAIGAEKIKNMFVAGMSGKDGESLYGWLCARMKNRPENTVEVYVDIAILNILNNLQGEYQTNNISNKIAWLVSYEGMYKEDLHEALSGYCGSIPDSVAFKGMAEGIAAQPRSSDSIKRYNQEINAYPLLTAYGEFKFSVLSRLGDEKARERFINCNLRLARSIAGRFQWTGMPEQDLVSQANEGIIKAVEKFEPWRGIKFSTYAVWWCRQAVISYMQDQKKQIRIPVHKLEEIRKFVKQAKQAGFDPYSEYVRSEDIAEAVNMTFEKVEELRSMVDVVMSLDQTPQDKHGDSMDADFYSSVGYEDVGFSKIERSDIVDAITAEVEKCFPKKDEKRRDRMCGVYEQRLLPMLLGDEYKTYREVGAMLGVSHELVRHDIEPVVIDILKRVITDLGVTQEDLFVYTTNRAAAAIVRHPGRNRPDSDVDLQDGGGRSETPQNSAIKNGSIFHGEVNGILADSFENNKENIEYLIKDGQPVMKGVFADVYNEYDPGKKSKLRDLMYIRGRDFLHFKIDPDTGEVIGYQSEHVGKGRKNRYSSVYIGEGDYHALKDERSLVKEFLEHCIAHIDNPPRRGESEEAYEARIEKIMPTANVREKLFSQERIARARVLYLAGQRMGERAKTGSVVFDMSIVAEYVNWAKEFANPNDLEVEIGCGRGEYLLEQAEKYPGKNFIGIEDDRELVMSIAKKVEEKNLKNVRLIYGDVKEIIPEGFGEKSIDSIKIRFPYDMAVGTRLEDDNRLFMTWPYGDGIVTLNDFDVVLARALKIGGEMEILTMVSRNIPEKNYGYQLDKLFRGLKGVEVGFCRREETHQVYFGPEFAITIDKVGYFDYVTVKRTRDIAIMEVQARSGVILEDNMREKNEIRGRTKRYIAAIKTIAKEFAQLFIPKMNDLYVALDSQEQGGRAIVLYADDIMNNVSLCDFKATIKSMRNSLMHKNGGSVVIYSSENKKSAEVLGNIVKEVSYEIGVFIVTDSDLANRGFGHRDEKDTVDSLLRFTKAQEMRNIVGVIKGPGRSPETLGNVAASHKIPVVFIGIADGVYSFAEAVTAALKAKTEKGNKKWLLWLEPIGKLTKTLHEEYFNSLKALIAA